MKQKRLDHEFIDVIPSDLKEGKLYISVRYRTAVHLCACGCGNKVVTPIRPAQWKLIFDGDSVSLWPSIGNWQFPCRSHYWIQNGSIQWAEHWTEDQVSAGLERDARNIHQYYENRKSHSKGNPPTGKSRKARGLVARVWAWFVGL